MKRIIALFLVYIVSLFALTSCAVNTTTTPVQNEPTLMTTSIHHSDGVQLTTLAMTTPIISRTNENVPFVLHTSDKDSTDEITPLQ